MPAKALHPLLFLTILFGCREGDRQQQPAGPLAAEVTIVRPDGTAADRVRAGDAITLVLRVRNSGGEVWQRTFSSSRQHDFRVVDRRSGAIVWTWSDDMGFLTVMTERELAPGEVVEFTAEWRAPSPGEYEVRGHFPPDEIRATEALVVDE